MSIVEFTLDDFLKILSDNRSLSPSQVEPLLNDISQRNLIDIPKEQRRDVRDALSVILVSNSIMPGEYPSLDNLLNALDME